MPFTSLPPEIYLNIIDFLDYYSVSTLGNTNHFCRNLIPRYKLVSILLNHELNHIDHLKNWDETPCYGCLMIRRDLKSSERARLCGPSIGNEKAIERRCVQCVPFLKGDFGLI